MSCDKAAAGPGGVDTGIAGTDRPLAGSRYHMRIEAAEAAAAEPYRDGERGWIHSFESGGTVDGPGVRFVLFLSGCSLRCQYCHNPDTWHMKYGREVTTARVLEEIGRYGKFLSIAGGGVTVSGGEPMVQIDFLASILAGCRQMGLHTAVDTCGFLGARMSDRVMADVDLFLLDIKSFDPDTYRRLTSQDLQPTLDFALRLARQAKPAWLRYVLVPGLTDAADSIDALARFAAELGNIERVEVLPFHKMGEAKWQALGLNYQLAATRPPTHGLVTRVQDQFRRVGLSVV